MCLGNRSGFSAHEKGRLDGDFGRRLGHPGIAYYAPNQLTFMPSMLPLSQKAAYNGSRCNRLLLKRIGIMSRGLIVA